MNRAVSSLPTPVSPRISTVESTFATRFAMAMTLSIALSSTIMSANWGSCAFRVASSERYRSFRDWALFSSSCRFRISFRSRSLQI